MNPAGIGRPGPTGNNENNDAKVNNNSELLSTAGFNPNGTFGHYDPFHPGYRGRGGSQPGLGVPGGVAR